MGRLGEKLQEKFEQQVDQRLVDPAEKREAALDALEARFDRPDYGPGERVSGRVVVPEPIDCRSVTATIRYAGVSREGFARGRVRDGPVTLHEGPLAGGEELRFDLRLPSPILPSYSSDVGRCYWSLWLDLVRPRRADTDRRLAIPVRLAETSFPEPGERPADVPAEGEGSNWDVKTYVERWSIRRGEAVSVDVTIGEPSSERRDLTIALRCVAKYLGSFPSADGNSQEGTKNEVVWEEVRMIDASIPEQAVRFAVPADAPFSYGGEALAFHWGVTVKEPRKLRRDLVRETAIQVRP